ARVAKAVWIEPHARALAELLFEKALTIQAMPHDGLTARHVAIRLQPPAAAQFPPALFHTRANFLEHLWVARLHPRIKARATRRELELRRLLHTVQRTAKGRAHFFIAFGPPPQPS